FSTTTTDVSGASCLSRIAAARPAGPAPTITTSNSIASRAGSCAVFMACSLSRALASGSRFAVLASIDDRTHITPGVNAGHKDARELLAFYLDAGADALLGEEPVDRMADEITPSSLPARDRGEAVRAEVSDQPARTQNSPTPDRPRPS